MLFEMLLVVICAPVVFEPVDEQLKRHVIRVMEVESLRPHLDELFKHFVLWHVAHDYVLRVDRQNGKAVRNSARLFLFLLFETRFKILERLRIGKLLVANDIPH